MAYEYRVIPAPKRLKRIKGTSSTSELFAATLTDAINAEARDGWEYVRSESLSAEEPAGWLRRAAIVEETVMIFRRPAARRAPEPRDDEAAGEPGRTLLRTEGHARGRQEPRVSGCEPHDEARPRAGDTPVTTPLLRPVPRRGPGDRK
jgi:hypothetical protein